MANILIICSTTDGHTRRICERIRLVVEVRNNKVEEFGRVVVEM
jgi:flavodoxin